MVTKAQNELLTRVENGAPMGRMMKENYWIPFALGSQLARRGDPILVTLLGEHYVAYRAADGRIGFFDEHCPHRGASLLLARVEDGHLRCIFHGWKFDVTGQLVECPSQQVNAEAFCKRVKAKTYPVHEAGGIVWVWLGEAGQDDTAAPPFPHLPITGELEKNAWLSVTLGQCNWLQAVEGTVDSVHINQLHNSFVTATAKRKPELNLKHAISGPPVYETALSPYGLRAAALRPVGEQTHVRVTEFFLPFVTLTPRAGTNDAKASNGTIFIIAPVDDTHHLLFTGPYSENERQDVVEFGVQPPGEPYDIHNFAPLRGTRENRWGQDRALMRAGHFSGFAKNLIEEDMVVQASMGPIHDRTRETLNAADVAVVQLRRLLLDEVAGFMDGRRPRGSALDAEPVAMRNPIDKLLPPGVRWQDWVTPVLGAA